MDDLEELIVDIRLAAAVDSSEEPIEEVPSDFDSAVSSESESEPDLTPDGTAQQRVVDRLTLGQYLKDPRFVVVDDTTGIITDVKQSAYSPEVRIDFEQTSEETRRSFTAIAWKKTYDVDAVFASFSLQNLAKGLHGSIAVSGFPPLATPKEMKSIRRHFRGGISITEAYRLGEVAWGLSVSDSLYLATDTARPKKELVWSALSRAASLPCRQVGGPSCTCGPMAPFHVSNRQSGRPIKQSGDNLERLSPAIVPCYFRALAEALAVAFPTSSWQIMVRSIGCKPATVSNSLICPTFVEELINPEVASKVTVDICVQLTPIASGNEAVWAIPSHSLLKRLYPEGQFYPQAFMGTYGNVHGTFTNGTFLRVNTYSTAHTLTSGRLYGNPFKYKGWVNELAKAFQTFVQAPQCLQRISENLKTETETAMSLVEAAAIHPGAIRQELTVTVDNVHKGLMKADRNSTDLTRQSLVLPGNLGVELYRYYLILLTKAMRACLASLVANASEYSTEGVGPALATFGIFESLVSGYLWTGYPMALSSKFTFGRHGLSLAAYTRQRGLAYFSNEYFDSQCLCARDLDILDQVLSKIKQAPEIRRTLRKINELNRLEADSDKTDLIIRTYAEDLISHWNLNTSDIEDPMEILKYPNTAERLECHVVPARRSWEEMVKTVFNPELLSNSTWSRPYLVLVSVLSKSDHRWEEHVKSAISRNRINQLHQYNSETRFDGSAKTFAAKTPSVTDSEVRPRRADSDVATRRADSEVAVPRFVVESLSKKRFWTDEETVELVEGVNAWGPGKWIKILEMKKESLARLNNKQLKDRWKTLMKKDNVCQGPDLKWTLCGDWRRVAAPESEGKHGQISSSHVLPTGVTRFISSTAGHSDTLSNRRSLAWSHFRQAAPVYLPDHFSRSEEAPYSDDDLPEVPWVQQEAGDNQQSGEIAVADGGDANLELFMARFRVILGERLAECTLSRLRSLLAESPDEEHLWSSVTSHWSSRLRPTSEERLQIFDRLCDLGVFVRVNSRDSHNRFKLSNFFVRHANNFTL